MDERILKFLYDIQQCISKIEKYTKHQTQEAYLEGIKKILKLVRQNQFQDIEKSIVNNCNPVGKILDYIFNIYFCVD